MLALLLNRENLLKKKRDISRTLRTWKKKIRKKVKLLSVCKKKSAILKGKSQITTVNKLKRLWLSWRRRKEKNQSSSMTWRFCSRRRNRRYWLRKVLQHNPDDWWNSILMKIIYYNELLLIKILPALPQSQQRSSSKFL